MGQRRLIPWHWPSTQNACSSHVNVTSWRSDRVSDSSLEGCVFTSQWGHYFVAGFFLDFSSGGKKSEDPHACLLLRKNNRGCLSKDFAQNLLREIHQSNELGREKGIWKQKHSGESNPKWSVNLSRIRRGTTSGLQICPQMLCWDYGTSPDLGWCLLLPANSICSFLCFLRKRHRTDSQPIYPISSLTKQWLLSCFPGMAVPNNTSHILKQLTIYGHEWQWAK